jgi:hypothetical protein
VPASGSVGCGLVNDGLLAGTPLRCKKVSMLRGAGSWRYSIRASIAYRRST